MRSETYLERLRRVWSRRLVIAAVCMVAALGAAFLINMPVNLMATPALPALPTPPAVVLLNLTPPAHPSSEGSQPVAAPPAASQPAASQPAASQPAASQPAAAGDYLIAVGLFADGARADRLVEELTQAGLPAGQRPVQLRRQRVQQVVLGPFANRSDAVESLNRLRQLGGHDDASLVVTSY